MQGLKNVARKTARVNPDLIDVDLVRGIYQLTRMCQMLCISHKRLAGAVNTFTLSLQTVERDYPGVLDSVFERCPLDLIFHSLQLKL